MNKIVPFLVSLAVFASLEIVSRREDLFFWIVPLLVALVIGSTITVVGLKIRKRLSLLILPTLYIAGVISIFIFLQEGAIRHVYILGSCIFLGLLLFNISKAARKTLEFSEEKSKRILINNIITLICTFFIYSGVVGLSVFLSWPAWIAILIILGVTFTLAYQSFWFAEILSYRTWLYILILTLIIAEASWCLAFWPCGFIALGCVLFSIYFVFCGITSAHLKKELTKRIVWQHLILGAILLIASLSTAKWTY